MKTFSFVRQSTAKNLNVHFIGHKSTKYVRCMKSELVVKMGPSNYPWPTLEALASARNKAGEERLAYDQP